MPNLYIIIIELFTVMFLVTNICIVLKKHLFSNTFKKKIFKRKHFNLFNCKYNYEKKKLFPKLFFLKIMLNFVELAIIRLTRF